MNASNEEKAEKSNILTQTVLETVGDGITLSDENGYFEIFNSKMQEITGYTLSEANGMDDFIEKLYPDMEERQKAYYFLNKLKKEKVIDEHEITIRCKNKIQKTLLVTSKIIEYNDKSYFLSAYRDITDRKKTERSLLETSQKFIRYKEFTPLGYIERDENFIIIDWNKAAERIFGYSKLEALFQNSIDLLVPIEQRREVFEIHELLLSQRGGKRSINKNITKDNKIIICSWYNTPLFDESGGIIGVASMVQNITERIEMIQELGNAKIAAEKASEAKSSFLANVSHELRTPLNGILGYASILVNQDNLTEKQKDSIEIIKRSGEHLLILINDILDLSKIEVGKMEIQNKEFNLISSLKSLVENTRIRIQQKGIKFIFTIHSKLPKIVFGDEIRIRQILINLLDNAIKYTLKGKIKFSIFPFNNKIRFQVADTGVGIKVSELKNIFEPFHRVKDNNQFEGVGLGLSISQKIANLMGSTLKVKSKKNFGSKFWFDLDLPIVDSNHSQEMTINNIIGYTNKNIQILIVDDKVENRMVLKDVLQLLNFSIIEAVDGFDAISKVKESIPDIIFMDLKMPNMNGIEATKELRKNEKLNGTIIIAISANVYEYKKIESIEAGCNGFLSKPITKDKIILEINKHFPIEWVYKNDMETDFTGDLNTPKVKPKTNIFNKLCYLIEYGERSDIFQELDIIKENSKEYSVFVDHVRKLVKNFQLISALKFVKDQVNTTNGDIEV